MRCPAVPLVLLSLARMSSLQAQEPSRPDSAANAARPSPRVMFIAGPRSLSGINAAVPVYTDQHFTSKATFGVYPGDSVWVTSCKADGCAFVSGPTDTDTFYVHQSALVDRRGLLAGHRALVRAASLTPPGKWHASRTRSEMDASTTTTLMLHAENQVIGLSGVFQPTLVIRCREGETELYVVTGVPAETENALQHEVTVRWRLDDSPAETETWSESTSYVGFFSPNPVVFARMLAQTRMMRFEFTRFQSTSAVIRFDVRGLPHHLGRVAAACGWEYP